MPAHDAEPGSVRNAAGSAMLNFLRSDRKDFANRRVPVRTPCAAAVDLPALRASLDVLAADVRAAFIRHVGEIKG
jgi:hypothetical protein